MKKASLNSDGWKILRLKNGSVVSQTEKENGKLRLVLNARVSATIFLTIEASEMTVDANIGPEANLAIICLQSSKKPAKIVQRAKVAEGGRVHWHNVTLGSDVTQELRSELTGSHARSDVDWIFRAANKDRQELTARNVFGAKSGEGEITIKGVASDHAHTFCDGMIEITEEGTGTDTYLTEDVLMLDKTAKVDAVPGLEIRTNDVKASHSATVSRVTAEDLFYFQSRGIREEHARQLYIEGFLGDLTERIEDHAIQTVILKSIKAQT